MLDLIGRSIGRFQILEELGRGGMAIVYKAFDTRLKTDVAVKFILPENLPQGNVERALKRFEREAELLARLTHPNIVPIIDYGEFEGRPYLVMKYLPGGSLQLSLNGQPMPWQEVTRLLIPVARALDYAHRQGAVHRDVKPSNILMTSDGEPMLTDFGIAKIIDKEGTQGLTTTSASMGTPYYMAPEQVVSKSVDARADIYSLGIVFYELVTGRKPYTGNTPVAVVIKHTREPLPDPRQFVPGLPESVGKVLQKALAKKPEDRYQSMNEFVAAMETLTAEQTIPAAGKLVEEIKKDAGSTILAYGSRPAPASEIPSVPMLPVEKPQRLITPWQWAAIGGILGLACIVVATLGILFFRGQIGLGSQAKPVAQTPTQTLTITPTLTLGPTLILTPTGTFTPTLTLPLTFTATATFTATPANPQLLADKNYLCLEGPATTFKHAADIYQGSTHDIIGRSQNDPGWYKLAIKQSNTHHTCCWIEGGGIQGNIDLAPYTETLCP